MLLAVVVAGASFAGVAYGHLSATDAAATHAYLEARLALGRAHAAHLSLEARSIDVLAGAIRAECPDVLQHEPESARTNAAGDEISLELQDAIFGAGERAEHGADQRFYATVRSLRWSNGPLTRRLHALALEQAQQSKLPAPALCADLRFWVESGYTATSPATKHYLKRWSAISAIAIESEPQTARRLAGYEDHADRLLAQRVLPPREPSSSSPAEVPFVEAVNRAFGALGAKERP